MLVVAVEAIPTEVYDDRDNKNAQNGADDAHGDYRLLLVALLAILLVPEAIALPERLRVPPGASSTLGGAAALAPTAADSPAADPSGTAEPHRGRQGRIARHGSGTGAVGRPRRELFDATKRARGGDGGQNDEDRRNEDEGSHCCWNLVVVELGLVESIGEGGCSCSNGWHLNRVLEAPFEFSLLWKVSCFCIQCFLLQGVSFRVRAKRIDSREMLSRFYGGKISTASYETQPSFEKN